MQVFACMSIIKLEYERRYLLLSMKWGDRKRGWERAANGNSNHSQGGDERLFIIRIAHAGVLVNALRIILSL